MQDSTNPRYTDVFVGYLWAVSGATITLVGTLVGLDPWLAQQMGVAVLFGAVICIWIFAFLGALIPFASSVVMASRFNIRSGWYYALCGVLTGVVLAAIFVAVDQLVPRSIEDVPAPGESFKTFLRMSGLFAAGGLSGAMTYWWKRGRLAGTETS
jgi:membrane associated rhomboid family serine protease